MTYTAYIRNCTTHQRTTTVVPNGGTIPAPAFAATIEFSFGPSVQAIFSTNGGSPVEMWSPPYTLTPSASNHDIPIDMSAGSKFNVSVTANSVLLAPFSFSIAAKAAWGANYIQGLNSPENNPILHPQIVATQIVLKQTWARLWTEYPQMLIAGTVYFDNAINLKLAAKARGFSIKIAAVYQWRDGNYLDWMNRVTAAKMPDGSNVIDAIMFGNESDDTDYYSPGMDNLAPMVAAMEECYQLAKAAGITFIATSFVHGMGSLEKAKAAGVYGSPDKPTCDVGDAHWYGTPAEVISGAQQSTAFFTAIGLGSCVSECGTTGAANTLTMLKGLAPIGAMIMPYSVTYVGDPAFSSYELNADYSPNGPQPGGMYAAYVAGMTGVA